MQAADEPHLIRRAKEGDAGAFRQLVERSIKQAYNVAYNVVRDHNDSEDIVQEACVRAFRSLGSFRGDAGFNTWLYRIVLNLSLNRSQQKKKVLKRTTRFEDDDASSAVTEVDVVEANDRRKHIQHGLDGLTALQRSVVVLRHIDGLSTKEVGKILRCSEGTVKTHLHRGLKKLKTLLNHLDETNS